MAETKKPTLISQLKDLYTKGDDWESLGIPNTKYMVVKFPANNKYNSTLGVKVYDKNPKKGTFYFEVESLVSYIEELTNALDILTTVLIDVEKVNGKRSNGKKASNSKSELVM